MLVAMCMRNCSQGWLGITVVDIQNHMTRFHIDRVQCLGKGEVDARRVDRGYDAFLALIPSWLIPAAWLARTRSSAKWCLSTWGTRGWFMSSRPLRLLHFSQLSLYQWLIPSQQHGPSLLPS